jgi:hypothetical protein
VCRSRRHGDVFGIAAGADRQVAGADENRLAERRLGGVGRCATTVPLSSMPGIAGSGGIQA